MSSSLLDFSVISTVKNEESNVREWLNSLLNQSRHPKEIIIVEGGSSDRTLDIIQEFVEAGNPIRCIVRRGVNISQGRNLAIQNAKCEIVASVDAGCTYDKVYFENLIAPFDKDSSIEVVSGWTIPESKSLFEKCVAEVYVEKIQSIKPDSITSSRSIAFKKGAWKEVGGYPEWLQTAEDTLFNLKLKEHNCKSVFVPNATVSWRMRTTFRAFLKQRFSYAIGDGMAKTHLWNFIALYLIYLTGLVFVMFALVQNGIWWLLFLVGFLGYLAGTCGRVAMRLFAVEKKFTIFFVLPLIKLTGNIISMIGFSIGTTRKTVKRD
jgi:glycosyltransferase involved in cell wall biosynthesis